MILWYALACFVFSMLTYILNVLLYYKKLSDKFQSLYPRRCSRIQINGGYEHLYIPNDPAIVREIYAAIERQKQRKNNECFQRRHMFILRRQLDLQLNLPADDLDQETRQRLKRHIKKVERNKKKTLMYSQSSSMHVKESKSKRFGAKLSNLEDQSHIPERQSYRYHITEPPVKKNVNLPTEPLNTKLKPRRLSSKLKFIKEYLNQPKVITDENYSKNKLNKPETTKMKNTTSEKNRLGDKIGFHMQKYDETKEFSALKLFQGKQRKLTKQEKYSGEETQSITKSASSNKSIAHSRSFPFKMALDFNTAKHMEVKKDKETQESMTNTSVSTSRSITRSVTSSKMPLKLFPPKPTTIKTHRTVDERKLQGSSSLPSVISNKSITHSTTSSFKIIKTPTKQLNTTKIGPLTNDKKSHTSNKLQELTSERTLIIDNARLSMESEKITVTTTVDESWIALMFKPADVSDSITSMETTKYVKDESDE